MRKLDYDGLAKELRKLAWQACPQADRHPDEKVKCEICSDVRDCVGKCLYQRARNIEIYGNLR